MKALPSAVAIVLLFFVYQFFEKNIVDNVRPEAFLPDDVILYAEQKNLHKSIQSIAQSPLGKTITSIDYLTIGREIELEESTIETMELFSNTFQQLKQNALLPQLFGDRVSIALYPQREWSRNYQSLGNALKKHFLFICNPTLDHVVFDTVVQHYVDDVVIDNISFGNYTIKRIVHGNEPIFASFAYGYLLVSFEERILREALRISEDSTSSVLANEDLSSLLKKVETSERYCFLSLEGARKFAKQVAAAVQSEKANMLLSEISTLNGFNDFGYGSWRDETGYIHDKFYFTIAQDDIEPRFKRMLETPPSLNLTLPYVRNDVLLYYWSNTFYLDLFWEMYVAEAGWSQQQIDDFEMMVSTIAGEQLDQLFNMVSSNVSLILRKSDRSQFVPIPDMAVLIKLNDPERLNEVVKDVLQKLEIKTKTNEYKSIQYNYWGLYDKESLQPVYTVHRDYLILANTLDVFKAVVDTPIDNNRLVETEAFNKLDPGFRRLNNSVWYIDQKSLLLQIREIVSWAGTMIAIQDRRAAAKSKVLIDKVINPILISLTMYQNTATRTYIEENRIIVESNTLRNH